MATASVDRPAMALAAQEIEAKAQIIQGLRNTLQDHKATLRQGWKGGAAGTFDHVFGEFDDDFSKVIQALETMYHSLTQTVISYEKHEQESHAAVSEVQRLLGGG
jgi:WXG100 family type VII secretion target